MQIKYNFNIILNTPILIMNISIYHLTTIFIRRLNINYLFKVLNGFNLNINI